MSRKSKKVRATQNGSRVSKQETRSRSRRASRNTPRHASLPQRSQSAYDRALHAIAAMRRDPNLTLSKAAKLEGVKFATVRKYFSSSLKWSGGRFRAKKSDRHTATLYIPDAHGGSVAVETRSFTERQQLSRYLRDLGRYLRGKRDALSDWHGRKIAGVELLTSGRAIAAIEPALSEFSLYRDVNSGVA